MSSVKPTRETVRRRPRGDKPVGEEITRELGLWPFDVDPAELLRSLRQMLEQPSDQPARRHLQLLPTGERSGRVVLSFGRAP